MRRFVPALSLVLLLSVAFAQSGTPGFAELFSHAGLVLLTGGAVAFIRQVAKGRIDGPVPVGILAVVVGAVVGVVATRLPFFVWGQEDALIAGLGWPLNGLFIGVICSIEAVFGVSLLQYVTKLLKSGNGQVSIDPQALLALAGKPSGQTPLDFVLSVATGLLGATPAGKWLDALGPLIAQYANHPGLLTDDLRATIQAQVLTALRKAGLPGQDLQ